MLILVTVTLILTSVQIHADVSPKSHHWSRIVGHLTKSVHKQQNMDGLPSYVWVRLIPIKIQDLSEKEEILEMTARIQISWSDNRLKWESQKYGGITEIILPGTQLWAPDIGILNSVSDIYYVIRDTRFEMKVEDSGRVWWHPTGVIRTYCKLRLRYFPFDRQNCSVLLESPTLDSRYMNLTLRPRKSPVDTRMYIAGETWNLITVGGDNVQNKLGRRSTFTRVQFYVVIERSRIFHILNVIFPAVFLSAMQILLFFLPATHVQRVGASTTVLLSVVVFHSIAVSQLPKTSTDVPLLAVHIFIVTFVSGISVFTSIFLAKFVDYAEKNRAIPEILLNIPNPLYHFNKLLGKCRPRKKNLPTSEKDAVKLEGSDVHNRRHLLPAAADQDETEEDDDMKGEGCKFLFNSWHHIGVVMDRVLMIIAAFTAILSPIILFVIIPMAAEEVS